MAPINAVSPYKETEIPKLSLAAASLAYSFDSTRDVMAFGALNTYTDPELCFVVGVLSSSS